MNKYDISCLKQKQSLSLDTKIILSKNRIKEFYKEMNGEVYIAFSGGKDSTVLLHLVRSIYPDVPAVFCDTGLEYPEVKELINKIDNVEIIRPELSFKEVLEKYGYPIVSKRVSYQLRQIKDLSDSHKATRKLYLTGIKSDGTISKQFKLPNKWRYLIDSPFKISEQCCYVMKKKPFKKYNKQTNKKPYIGIMAEDSNLRTALYLIHGCNILTGRNVQSKPLSFWTTDDIWKYIKKYKLEYADIYNKGIKNTGCMFCMFGIHYDNKPNRFQILKKIHPKIWKYCMNNLKLKEVLEFMEIPYE